MRVLILLALASAALARTGFFSLPGVGQRSQKLRRSQQQVTPQFFRQQSFSPQQELTCKPQLENQQMEYQQYPYKRAEQNVSFKRGK